MGALIPGGQARGQTQCTRPHRRRDGRRMDGGGGGVAVWGGHRPADRQATQASQAPCRRCMHGPSFPLIFHSLASHDESWVRLAFMSLWRAVDAARGVVVAGCGAAAAGRAVLGVAATPTSYRLHAACRRSPRIASFLTGKALATPPRPGILAEPPDIPLAGVSLSPAAVDRAVSALHKD